MSDIIPNMTISEFKLLKAHQIKELKAVEVYSDGSYLFTAIIPHGDIFAGDYIKIQAERLGLKANISGGVDPKKVKEEVVA